MKTAENRKIEEKNEQPAMTSVWNLVARIAWAAICPAAILLLLFSVSQDETQWIGVKNGALFFFAALAIVARWADQRSGACTNMDESPSTRQDFLRYLVYMTLFVVFGWLVANIYGTYR